MEINYKALSMEIFKEQNKIRTDPSSYIKNLQKALEYFKGKIYRQPNETPVETFEGEEGVKDAIEFLEKQEPVKPLIFSNELSLAASDHSKDIGKQGLSNHKGSNGNNISDRIEKYIEWDGLIAESLDFCYKSAENIIMNLVIDDGSKEKRQRFNLFNKEFLFTGIACNKHKLFKICTVIEYAKGLHDIGDEPPDAIIFDESSMHKTVIKDNSSTTKTLMQLEDPDSPEDAVSVKSVHLSKKINGVKRNITQKIYLLKSGKQHVIEIETK